MLFHDWSKITNLRHAGPYPLPAVSSIEKSGRQKLAWTLQFNAGLITKRSTGSAEFDTRFRWAKYSRKSSWVTKLRRGRGNGGRRISRASLTTSTDWETSACSISVNSLHTHSTRQVVYESSSSGMMMAASILRSWGWFWWWRSWWWWYNWWRSWWCRSWWWRSWWWWSCWWRSWWWRSWQFVLVIFSELLLLPPVLLLGGGINKNKHEIKLTFRPHHARQRPNRYGLTKSMPRHRSPSHTPCISTLLIFDILFSSISPPPNQILGQKEKPCTTLSTMLLGRAGNVHWEHDEPPPYGRHHKNHGIVEGLGGNEVQDM